MYIYMIYTYMHIYVRTSKHYVITHKVYWTLDEYVHVCKVSVSITYSSSQHIIHQCTKTPPIYSFTMTSSLKDFWSPLGKITSIHEQDKMHIHIHVS